MNDLEPFAKLAVALSPWRGQLVFIGGWAHRLHRLDPRANTPEHQPVFTRDTDLAFANREHIEGDMKAALLEHGFKEKLSGDFKPPTASYTLGDDSSGFYAEFLTPLIGSGIKRGGGSDATLAKAGISAQKIRHLDVLLVDPWTIALDPKAGFQLPTAMDIRVANPLCFMVQKFLIIDDRTPEKQAQDLLYVYDTIEVFGGLLAEFQTSWKEIVAPSLGKQAARIREATTSTFAGVNDVIRAAARIPTDRKLSPEDIQQTCQIAFEQIFS